MFFSIVSPDGSVGIAFGVQLIISDAKSGLLSTRTFPSPIAALAFAPAVDSTKSGYFTVSTDDKSLYAIAFNTNGNIASSASSSLSTSTTTPTTNTLSSSPPTLDILGETKTPRRTHSLCAMFLPSSNESVIVAGDKVGDVWVFPLPNLASKRRHVLTHTASIITAVSGGGGGDNRSYKYLITADRDEKLRVSSWPRCFNVESYCLGHTRFVSTLCLVTNPPEGSSLSSGELMVSGGGDGALRLWHLRSGRLLHTLYLKKKVLSEFSFEYIAEASVGAHSDGDMVDATADSGGGGDQESGAAGAEDEEVEEEVEETVMATSSTIDDIDKTKEEKDNEKGITLSSERKAPLAPAVVPLSLVELSSGFFAVFIEGEGAVRIISLRNIDGNNGGNSSTSYEPRLSQESVITLGGKVLPQTLGAVHLETSSSSSSSSSPSLLLLVGTIEKNDNGKVVRQLRVYTRISNSSSSSSSSLSSSTSSSSSWVAPILSSAANQEWARRIANVNSELTRIADLNEKDEHALFSNVLSANLSEYDKSEHCANASW